MMRPLAARREFALRIEPTRHRRALIAFFAAATVLPVTPGTTQRGGVFGFGFGPGGGGGFVGGGGGGVTGGGGGGGGVTAGGPVMVASVVNACSSAVRTNPRVGSAVVAAETESQSAFTSGSLS